MTLLTERYEKQIRGQIACFDRVVMTGILPDICHSKAITSRLYAAGIRIFDYTQFATPLRDELRANALDTAKQEGLEIEFVRSTGDFRKEERISQILKTRGSHPGLVHIFSAMEGCAAFEPWHDKKSGQTFLRYTDGK